MPNREQRRAAHNLALPKTALPNSQELLAGLVSQQQQMLSILAAQAQLLEVLCRAALGQNAENIDLATGLSFPELTAAEKAEVRERRAEAESRAAEDRRLMEEAAEDLEGPDAEHYAAVQAANAAKAAEEVPA